MSDTSFRTGAGGRIDRSRRIAFTFDGRTYHGHPGDTLASALLANGVHLVGRSFKYHRPRGILSAGSEEPSALVQLESGGYSEPNLRATQVELYEGLNAASQNAWPSVRFDVGAVNGLLSKIFVAGFYYKTFMHPQSLWMKVYEPLIRRAAGLGKPPREADPDRYDKMHIHCDVLVVGAGPAGLAAARAAAATGARVILADEQGELGGSLLGSTETIDGLPAAEWVARVEAELAGQPETRILRRTVVSGYYDHNHLTLVERRTDHLPRGRSPLSRQRLWNVRAKRVVLATGSHERPLVFADNDRPGVMLASAVRTYVNRFGVKPGSRAVVLTNNDSAYAAALDMQAAGIAVAAIVDLRPSVTGVLPAKARAAGIQILENRAVVATEGGTRVKAVEVMALAPDGGGVSGERIRIACDLLAMSGGWNPAVHLFSQSMGKLRYDEPSACFVPARATQALASAGACNGAFALPDCLAQGAAAGAEAAALAGFTAERPLPVPQAERVAEEPLRPLWIVPTPRPVGHGSAKHFVDFQNDVTAADVLLASREGYQSVEHLKRYTTTGMGTDQGKTSNVNALAILAKSLAAPIPQVGTTTFRPPYTPVTFGTLAGRDVGALADPARVTPMHRWHVENGAVFEDVGQWKRPWYFTRSGETLEEAVRRECRAVRSAVGVLDASTLGKIDIQGPDAATLLNRMYTNAWSKLETGRCRYGVMCKEDGMVMDDGVTTRLGPNHFLMTTTTGNAAKVLDWLEEYIQTEWPDLRVHLTSVTEHWATASIAGPKAREVVAALAPGLDLGAEAFPFMAMREASVAGVPARIFRISFTGELSYEINVPSYYGLHLWTAIMQAGAPYGITPYGTETMHVLRAEKGYIIVGQETDGTVTPYDLGMDWIVSKQKPDFVGKRSFVRQDTARTDRKQLVGLLTADPKEVLPEGAQITAVEGGAPPVPMLGHVTSSYWSETLGRSIALALIRGGAGRQGTTVYAPLAGRTVACTVTKPVFYDPEGVRLHG